MDPEQGDETVPLSLTPFIYGAASPVNEVDPTGRDFNSVSLGAIGNIISLNATLAVAGAFAKAVAIVCTAELVASTIGNDPTNSPCQVYWVRLQAQGPATVKDYIRGGPNYNVINHEIWIGPRPFPATVTEGLSGLEQLKLQLRPAELKDRLDSFRRANRFIGNAPPGGVGPPGRSFGNKEASSVRVDVDIKKGINFRN